MSAQLVCFVFSSQLLCLLVFRNTFFVSAQLFINSCIPAVFFLWFDTPLFSVDRVKFIILSYQVQVQVRYTYEYNIRPSSLLRVWSGSIKGFCIVCLHHKVED